MIPVTKSFLPSLEEYQRMVAEIWDSGQLTNFGKKATTLETQLTNYLGVKNLMLCNNGTIALQLAIKALELKGEIITTPFSYVATVSSIVWEGCQPVFVDINQDDLCIDANKIESAITEQTTGILATHVYGNPCNVKQIRKIADKHNLKVIYDAAHAFGIKLNGESILNYGDISTLSFHATKVFHTAEGGAVVTNNDKVSDKIRYLGNFGHKNQEEFWGLGINTKMSEFHAAMGLCILPHFEDIVKHRKKSSEHYTKSLSQHKEIEIISSPSIDQHNYSYYPVLFKSENQLLKTIKVLNGKDIYPRRYFYPSLNKLPYVNNQNNLQVTEDISPRILCLPLSSEISANTIDRICSIILETL